VNVFGLRYHVEVFKIVRIILQGWNEGQSCCRENFGATVHAILGFCGQNHFTGNKFSSQGLKRFTDIPRQPAKFKIIQQPSLNPTI
jgi:hypothetical protein